MVFKGSLSGQVPYKQYVKRETNGLYLSGIAGTTTGGIRVQAIICDGRRRYSLSNPLQFRCAVFTWQPPYGDIWRRTPNYRPAGNFGRFACHWQQPMKKASKAACLNGTINGKGRKAEANGTLGCTHRKLRSAYRSLRTNLPRLFTWYGHEGLSITNTTNAIDGHFAHLKNKLRNHNGLSIDRKKKITDEFSKARRPLKISTVRCYPTVDWHFCRSSKLSITSWSPA